MFKLGVIGFGSRANAVINGALRVLAPDLKITGIVDPNEQEVRKKLKPQDENVKFYQTLPMLLKDAKPDALFIGTRCDLHASYAIEAAAYDLPLFLEKPVAISMNQALALEAAFENSHCNTLVSFPLRCSPLCTAAKALLTANKIGTPKHVNAINYVPYGSSYFQSFYRDYSISHGLLLQKATHDLDYLMYLMNSPITKINAIQQEGHVFGGNEKTGLKCSECQKTASCPESPLNLQLAGLSNGQDHLCPFSKSCGSPATGLNEDASCLMFEFETGAIGSYSQVFFTRRKGRRGAIISGYEGTMNFDWYQSTIQLMEHFQPFHDSISVENEHGHFGGDIELAADFIAMVMSHSDSKCSILDGLNSAYACLAAREAALSGSATSVRRAGQI